jgi:hypothetical protein
VTVDSLPPMDALTISASIARNLVALPPGPDKEKLSRHCGAHKGLKSLRRGAGAR